MNIKKVNLHSEENKIKSVSENINYDKELGERKKQHLENETLPNHKLNISVVSFKSQSSNKQFKASDKKTTNVSNYFNQKVQHIKDIVLKNDLENSEEESNMNKFPNLTCHKNLDEIYVDENDVHGTKGINIANTNINNNVSKENSDTQSISSKKVKKTFSLNSMSPLFNKQFKNLEMKTSNFKSQIKDQVKHIQNLSKIHKQKVSSVNEEVYDDDDTENQVPLKYIKKVNEDDDIYDDDENNIFDENSEFIEMNTTDDKTDNDNESDKMSMTNYDSNILSKKKLSSSKLISKPLSDPKQFKTVLKKTTNFAKHFKAQVQHLKDIVSKTAIENMEEITNENKKKNICHKDPEDIHNLENEINETEEIYDDDENINNNVNENDSKSETLSLKGLDDKKTTVNCKHEILSSKEEIKSPFSIHTMSPIINSKLHYFEKRTSTLKAAFKDQLKNIQGLSRKLSEEIQDKNTLMFSEEVYDDDVNLNHHENESEKINIDDKIYDDDENANNNDEYYDDTSEKTSHNDDHENRSNTTSDSQSISSQKVKKSSISLTSMSPFINKKIHFLEKRTLNFKLLLKNQIQVIQNLSNVKKDKISFTNDEVYDDDENPDNFKSESSLSISQYLHEISTNKSNINQTLEELYDEDEDQNIHLKSNEDIEHHDTIDQNIKKRVKYEDFQEPSQITFNDKCKTKNIENSSLAKMKLKKIIVNKNLKCMQQKTNKIAQNLKSQIRLIKDSTKSKNTPKHSYKENSDSTSTEKIQKFCVGNVEIYDDEENGDDENGDDENDDDVYVSDVAESISHNEEPAEIYDDDENHSETSDTEQNFLTRKQKLSTITIENNSLDDIENESFDDPDSDHSNNMNNNVINHFTNFSHKLHSKFKKQFDGINKKSQINIENQKNDDEIYDDDEVENQKSHLKGVTTSILSNNKINLIATMNYYDKKLQMLENLKKKIHNQLITSHKEEKLDKEIFNENSKIKRNSDDDIYDEDSDPTLGKVLMAFSNQDFSSTSIKKQVYNQISCHVPGQDKDNKPLETQIKHQILNPIEKSETLRTDTSQIDSQN